MFFHNWINKLFPEENKVPRRLFEARKVSGSATCKQNTTLWNCVVIYSVYTVMKTSLFLHKVTHSVDEDLSLRITFTSSKLHSAPLMPTWNSHLSKRYGMSLDFCTLTWETQASKIICALGVCVPSESAFQQKREGGVELIYANFSVGRHNSTSWEIWILYWVHLWWRGCLHHCCGCLLPRLCN